MYPDNWNEIREIIYKRDNYTCQYCGNKYLGINAHHIKPLGEGGEHTFDNLITVCDICHSILHPGNTELEDKAKSHFNITIFNSELYGVNKLSDNDETLEDEQGFHSIEDNFNHFDIFKIRNNSTHY